MAQASSIDRAVRASEALCGIARAAFPFTVEHQDEPLRLAGSAMVARGAGTLEAIAKLAPLGLAADSLVLLHVLFEHVVVSAWLAADPDRNLGLWLKREGGQRLAMHNDWIAGNRCYLRQTMSMRPSSRLRNSSFR